MKDFTEKNLRGRMKTLKLFRALSMAGGLTCFMISCLPDIKGENGYDWMMIAVIALVLVILPTSLISRIKREDHPETLTIYTKGYHILNIISGGIMIGLCITAIVVKSEYLQPVITQYFASNKSEIWS